MPYIHQDDRDELRAGERGFAGSGELNYYLTCACIAYVNQRVMSASGPVDRVRYSDINDCIGALECAKLELYRRVGEPVENLAVQRNGEVYPTHLTSYSASDAHPSCGTDDCCGTCDTAKFDVMNECMDCGDDCGSCGR